MKKLFLLLFLALLCPSLAEANPASVTPADLSARDRVDIAHIQDYLNKLKNVSSSFLQIDDAGGIMHGNLAISRPGKMRVTYDPPSKDFIIADGSFVHIWDDSLQSQTNIEQGSSLAEFILRDPVRLNGDVTITKFVRHPDKMEVTLVQTKDPGAGSLTLVFAQNPFRLRQWKVIDAQGHETGVNLEDMSEVAVFPPDTFVFVPPNFSKNP